MDKPLGNPNDDELLDQLVEQFTNEVRAGQRPSIQDYQRKHPELKEEIADLLTSVAMIEGLKEQSGSTVASKPGRRIEALNLERIGDYRILQEIGRGGMGVVVHAIHESLGRHVAIKILPNHLVSSEKFVERFTREARAAAKMHHTNIVGVFGAGQSEGFHYYVMEYIDGCGLDHFIRVLTADNLRTAGKTIVDQTVLESDLGNNDLAATLAPGSAEFSETKGERKRGDSEFSLSQDLNLTTDEESGSHNTRDQRLPDIPKGNARYRWAAKLCADVADALAYAHQQGALHRDIKPANLLLDRSGHVWLADFGLVKHSTDQRTLTQLGDVLGTPQYMAPESFAGEYDAASETYCLGTTLYELATLHPKCPAGNALEIIRNVSSKPVVPPQKIDPRLPRDLATIIEKSLSSQKSARYQTADEMRDDLRAFVAGRPISARPASWMRRGWMWAKRNPWQSISALLLAFATIVASTGYINRSKSLKTLSSQNQQLITERDNTNKARQDAEDNLAFSVQVFEEMFRKIVVPDSDSDFSFDGFSELSGIETTVSRNDAAYLEKMLEFFERFAESNAGNVQVQFQGAKAWRRVANIYHLLGQFEKANKAYQEASRQFAEAWQSSSDLETWISYSQTINERGQLMLRHQGYQEAFEIFEGNLNDLKNHRFADHPLMKMQQVQTLNLLGSSGSVDATNEMIREREQATDAELEKSPSGTRRFSEFGTRKRLRNRPRFHSEIKKNVGYVEAAIELLNQMILEDDEKPQLVVERAKSNFRLAELYYLLKSTERGRELRQLALDDLFQINEEAEEYDESLFVRAQIHAFPIGMDEDEAKEQLLIGKELCQQLRDDDDDKALRSMDYLQLTATINVQLGQLFSSEGDRESAIECYDATLDDLLDVSRNAQNNQRMLTRINEVSIGLAELYIEDARYHKARDVLMKNIQRSQLRPGNSLGLSRKNRARRSQIIYQYELIVTCSKKLGDQRGLNRASASVERWRRLLEDDNRRDNTDGKSGESPRRDRNRKSKR